MSSYTIYQSVISMSQENAPVNANSTEETVNSQETVIHDEALPTTPAGDIESVISHAIQEEAPHPEDHPAPTTASLADFEQFMKALRDAQEPERKLDIAIQFMQQRLAQAGVPHFKEFWDARRICLDLFKENINPTSRVHLWASYSELCRQARKLKEIFDEQSAFAAEQIEIAVAAIESELAQVAEYLDQMPLVDLGVDCRSLDAHLEEYRTIQRELNLLNTYATKTSGLRKELIKTEMRIRQKNKFFERLSKLGDAIFPRRKELIQKVSQLFMQDVDNFIKTTFVSELKTVQLFTVRDEIKALQSIAKVLTLNTEAFSSTRKTLSECWDSIKNVVKERRKVASEQKSAYKEHRDQFVAELEALKASFEAKEVTSQAAETKLEEISGRMRNTSLGKLEIRELRDMVRDLRQVFTAHTQSEDTLRRQQANKKEQEKKARIEAVRQELQALGSDQTTLAIEELERALEPLTKEVATLTVPRAEKQEFDKLVRNVRDLIAEKKEQKLLSLSEGDREAIGKLKDLLKEKKLNRQTIKSQIDTWRKESGSSGVSIGQAMQYNEMIENEKQRLEKVEGGIDELQAMISKLQR